MNRCAPFALTANPLVPPITTPTTDTSCPVTDNPLWAPDSSTFSECVTPPQRSPAAAPAWVDPSSLTRDRAISASAEAGVMRQCCVAVWYPAPSARSTKRLVSNPAGRPLWASVDWSVNAFAFSMNCRSEPCPASLVLTIVEKLNPKSTFGTAPPVTVTAVTDCAAVVAVASEASVAFVVFDAASPLAGDSPPTRSVTATAVPVAASVRKVCTGRCVAAA